MTAQGELPKRYWSVIREYCPDSVILAERIHEHDTCKDMSISLIRQHVAHITNRHRRPHPVVTQAMLEECEHDQRLQYLILEHLAEYEPALRPLLESADGAENISLCDILTLKEQAHMQRYQRMTGEATLIDRIGIYVRTERFLAQTEERPLPHSMFRENQSIQLKARWDAKRSEPQKEDYAPPLSSDMLPIPT